MPVDGHKSTRFYLRVDDEWWVDYANPATKVREFEARTWAMYNKTASTRINIETITVHTVRYLFECARTRPIDF